eukprot:403366383
MDHPNNSKIDNKHSGQFLKNNSTITYSSMRCSTSSPSKPQFANRNSSQVLIPKYDLNNLFLDPPVFDKEIMRQQENEYENNASEGLRNRQLWKTMERVISSPLREDKQVIANIKNRQDKKVDLLKIEDKQNIINQLTDMAHKFPFYCVKLRHQQIETLKKDKSNDLNNDLKLRKHKSKHRSRQKLQQNQSKKNLPYRLKTQFKQGQINKQFGTMKFQDFKRQSHLPNFNKNDSLNRRVRFQADSSNQLSNLDDDLASQYTHSISDLHSVAGSERSYNSKRSMSQLSNRSQHKLSVQKYNSAMSKFYKQNDKLFIDNNLKSKQKSQIQSDDSKIKSTFSKAVNLSIHEQKSTFEPQIKLNEQTTMNQDKLSSQNLESSRISQNQDTREKVQSYLKKQETFQNNTNEKKEYNSPKNGVSGDGFLSGMNIVFQIKKKSKPLDQEFQCIDVNLENKDQINQDEKFYYDSKIETFQDHKLSINQSKQSETNNNQNQEILQNSLQNESILEEDTNDIDKININDQIQFKPNENQINNNQNQNSNSIINMRNQFKEVEDDIVRQVLTSKILKDKQRDPDLYIRQKNIWSRQTSPTQIALDMKPNSKALRPLRNYILEYQQAQTIANKSKLLENQQHQLTNTTTTMTSNRNQNSKRNFVTITPINLSSAPVSPKNYKRLQTPNKQKMRRNFPLSVTEGRKSEIEIQQKLNQHVERVQLITKHNFKVIQSQTPQDMSPKFLTSQLFGSLDSKQQKKRPVSQIRTAPRIMEQEIQKQDILNKYYQQNTPQIEMSKYNKLDSLSGTGFVRNNQSTCTSSVLQKTTPWRKESLGQTTSIIQEFSDQSVSQVFNVSLNNISQAKNSTLNYHISNNNITMYNNSLSSNLQSPSKYKEKGLQKQNMSDQNKTQGLIQDYDKLRSQLLLFANKKFKKNSQC